MSLGTYFSHTDTSLSNLSSEVLCDITGIVFSCRDGISTICAVTPSISTLSRIMGDVPSVIQEAVTGRYFVDLASLGSDRVRLYVDSEKPDEMIVGYYFSSNNEMLIEKRYKKPSEASPLLCPVDRYDNSGRLISANEPEAVSDRSCWTGSAAWADAADGSPYTVRYTHKLSKPQSYIFVFS